MLHQIRVLITIIIISGFMFADVFMTELTDPQNSGDTGRYVELYNSGDSAVDLSEYSVQRWTNDNADPTPSSVISLSGTIEAGEFYIICNDDVKFFTTYGMDCHQDISTGGFADSNGDDNMALLKDGEIVDMFGVAGEDGSGTWHEFEDGRAERTVGTASGCVTGCESSWVIDNDSGLGDGPVYAPEGFDPMAWIGAEESNDDSASGTTHAVDVLGMSFSPSVVNIEVGDTVEWVWVTGFHNVNGSLSAYPNNPEGFESEMGSGLTFSHTFNIEGTYDYHCDPHLSMDMVGTVVVSGGADECASGVYDCAGDCDGSAVEDCLGVCGGSAVVDECGECGGNGLSCLEPEDTFNLFFSEVAEGSSNNKYIEIYNGDVEEVDLNQYSISTCSNGCDEPGVWDYPNNVTFEPGVTVNPGDVYVVCHGSAEEPILFECDQFFTYLSNGDDVMALTQVSSGAVLDVVGLVGEDPGDGWEVAGIPNATKDHTLVRKSSVDSGNPLWLDNPETGDTGSAGTNADNSEWVVLDQDMWEYLGYHPHDFSSDVMGCMDETACNYSADATVDDGSCASLDCAGECGGDAVCEVSVTFSVDMSVDGSTSVNFRVSTVDGSYVGNTDFGAWSPMDDSDGDMIYTHTMMLETGAVYGYNFNNGGYESSDGLADCAGGIYGNDRYLTPGNTDMILDTVCFGSCEACPEISSGCTDSTATNYNEDANVDDGSCEYEAVEYANLFISEAAEGSSNNKYIEIYNASDDTVDLSGYAYPTVGNAPTVPGQYEYWNTFAEGASVAPGDVYVICHGSADEFILAECDEFYTYLSNGDDGFCLVGGSEGNFSPENILDCLGDWNGDPGSGWDVAGVSAATKDHTLVRKASVTTGNDGLWEFSAGESDDDSEWVVLDQNDWTYLGSHPHSFDVAIEGCMDMTACNYNSDATADDGSCVYDTDCTGECGGTAELDECGVCEGDNSTCTDECGIVNGTNTCSGQGLWGIAIGSDYGDGCSMYEYSSSYYYPEYFFDLNADGTGISNICTYDYTNGVQNLTWIQDQDQLIVTLDCGYNYNGNDYISLYEFSGSIDGNDWTGSWLEIGYDYDQSSQCFVSSRITEETTLTATHDIHGNELPVPFETTVTPDLNQTRDCFVVGPDADCAGECFGDAVVDECGLCDGDGPAENFDCDGNCLIDVDCLGECGGTAELDECGVCEGDNSTCTDECGIVNGTNTCSGQGLWGIAIGSDYGDGCSMYEYSSSYYYPEYFFDLNADGTGISNICTYDYTNGVQNLTWIQDQDQLIVTLDCGYNYNGNDYISLYEFSGSIDGNDWTGSWLEIGYDYDQSSQCFVSSRITEETTLTATHDIHGNELPVPFETTVTPDLNQTRDCFVVGPDADCAGECFGDAVVDECGLCDGDGSACTDECGVVGGDGVACSTVFNVDMNCANTEFSTVHITGPFCGWCGAEEWNTMSDEDGDGIYSLTLYDITTPFEYKYMVDNFADQENLIDDMVDGATCAPVTDYSGYANRVLGMSGDGLVVNDTYGSCLTCEEQSFDPEYTVTFDLDGLDECGFVSVTGSFDNWSGWGANTDTNMSVELTDGDYEYIVLCVDTSADAWWNDIWGNSVEVHPNLGGDCDFIPDDEYANFGFTVSGSDLVVTSCVESECTYNGDANGDGSVNVTDIVLIVGMIINGNGFTDADLCTSDLNQDGQVNVTDIVFLVGNIINGIASHSFDDTSIATEARIKIIGNQLFVDGVGGKITGVQLVLNHNSDFDIELENVNPSNLEFSGIRKIDSNTTEVLVVKDNLNKIAMVSGDYEILSAIIVSGKGQNAQEIASSIIELPEGFELRAAYPNPFNPTTTLEMAVPKTGYVSVKVYNLVGQEIATLVNGVIEATNSYKVQWNAASVASGVYLVRAESLGSVQTQKLMLLK